MVKWFGVYGARFWVGRRPFFVRIGQPRANGHAVKIGIGGIAQGITGGRQKYLRTGTGERYGAEELQHRESKPAQGGEGDSGDAGTRVHGQLESGIKRKEGSEAKKMKRGKSYRMQQLAVVLIEGEGGEGGRKEI